MTIRLFVGAILSAFVLAAEPLSFHNRHLEATLEPFTGHWQVRDKRNGRLWAQPAPEATATAGIALDIAPATAASIRQSTPHHISHRMTGDAGAISGPADCSATLWLGWEGDALLISMDISDDTFLPATSTENWWHQDSIEFWLNNRQYAVLPTPGNARVLLYGSGDVAAAQAEVSTTATGYRLDLRLPLPALQLSPTKPFRFAIGVNDADNPEKREGQIYFPQTWRHSSPDTFALLTLRSADKAAAGIKEKAPEAAYRDCRLLPSGRGVSYRREKAGCTPLQVSAELHDSKAELIFTVTPEDGSAPMTGEFSEILGFIVPDQEGSLIATDYSAGHLYQLNQEPFPRPTLRTACELPFICMLDMASGDGYGIIVDTPEDGTYSFIKVPCGEGTTRIPELKWMPTMKTFGERSRQYRFMFVAGEGYVSIAKAWREWAREHGYLVTLKEKARHNPNVHRLMGAADIWGGNNGIFPAAAKSYGINKLLINGPCAREHMQKMIDLGYLPGRYDVYTDVYNDKPEDQIDALSAPIPGHIVQKENGEKMVAWIPFDKSRTSYKRCPSLILDAAKRVIPRDLERYPYLARFLDVTSAEGLYECYHPDHPISRLEKRQHSEDIFAYFGNWQPGNLNLVAGGEQGKWWCAPYLHYLEGMQSGGYYSWPAGHLRRPKTKEDDARGTGRPTQRFYTHYEVYGIGTRRVPLWDLVFHDCISSTWYWGDTNDFLIEAAPEVTPRKDALNVLLASMSTFWVNKGTWKHDRSSFLRSYFHTTKVHETLGMEEMLSHRFLSADRCLQQTDFADGSSIVVNIADEPRDVVLKGRQYRLCPNGFAVDGPKLWQQLVLGDDGLIHAEVHAPDFFYQAVMKDTLPRMDGTSSLLAMTIVNQEAKNHLKIAIVQGNSLPIPTDFLKQLGRGKLLVYRLDEDGKRSERISSVIGPEGLQLPGVGNYEIFSGDLAKQPDFQLFLGALDDSAFAAAPHVFAAVPHVFTLPAIVANHSRAAQHADVKLYLNEISDERLLQSLPTGRIAAGKTATVAFKLNSAEFCGDYTFIAVVTPRKGNDLTPADNTSSSTCLIESLPLSSWPLRASFALRTGDKAARLAPLSFPVDFSSQLPAGGGLKPNDVRVYQRVTVPHHTRYSEQLLPLAQFMPAADDARRGQITLAFSAAANSDVIFTVVAKPGLSMHPSGRPQLQLGKGLGAATVCTETYQLAFLDGVLMDLAPGRAFPRQAPFLRHFVVSSAETGWSNEDQGFIKRFEVLENGPAKSSLVVVKTLKNGTTYTKTYTFLPDRFEVAIDLDGPAGSTYNRGFYRLTADYLDNGGTKGRMDNSVGETGGISGRNPNPQWFALRGDGWAHSCVALSTFGNITYWDGDPPNLGQLGFNSRSRSGNRMVYFIHGQQDDFSFVENDARRAKETLSVTPLAD
ncbi:MAG: glycoside hydrolase [Lentisphaeria bacterium]|jgi:hypothetical protein